LQGAGAAATQQPDATNMKPRTKAGFWSMLTKTFAVVFALGWAAQFWWQSEFHPCSSFAAGFGGGAMKLGMGGNAAPAASMFPPSSPVDFPVVGSFMSQRSAAWTWGFHANFGSSPFVATIPMWFPVAFFGFLAWHFRSQGKLIARMSGKHCQCGQDMSHARPGEPCSACGARMRKAA
jgi:hypothetical protein